MATELPILANGNGPANIVDNKASPSKGDDTSGFAVKIGLARMLKGGVIMDVVNAEQVR